MQASDWVALGVGVCAAIVATVALVWNVRRERRKVVVRVGYANGMRDSGWLAIEVTNYGTRVNIQEIGFVLSNGDTVSSPSEQPSFGWLERDDSRVFIVRKQTVHDMNKEAREHGQRIVAAYVRDSTSRYYPGKVGKHFDWFNL